MKCELVFCDHILSLSTRDLINNIQHRRVQVELRGMPVTLLDTAGMRDTVDKVEALGVQRSAAAAAAADIVLFVYDAQVCCRV